MGRKRYWKEEAEIVDGIAVYVIVLLFIINFISDF